MGLLNNNVFRRVAGGFKTWSRWLGNQQARLLLLIVYATAIVPFGLAVRLFSDPLRVKSTPKQWLDHAEERVDIDWAHRAW
jgi:hypothetical protein